VKEFTLADGRVVFADQYKEAGSFEIEKLHDSTTENPKWRSEPFLPGAWCVVFEASQVPEGQPNRAVFRPEEWDKLINGNGEVATEQEVVLNPNNGDHYLPDIKNDSHPFFFGSNPNAPVKEFPSPPPDTWSNGWPAPPEVKKGEERIEVLISLPKSLHDWLVCVAEIEERTTEQQIAFLLKDLIKVQ
jgi:hypothetical protein